jgi:hypothetical protein
VENGMPLVLPLLNRRGSKSAGRNAEPTAGYSSHVRFIVEASFLSDFSNWAVRVLELLPGMSRTQVRDVIANRLPEVAAERNRHGHRVNTRRRSHLRQAYPARIFGMDQFHRFGEPGTFDEIRRELVSELHLCRMVSLKGTQAESLSASGSPLSGCSSCGHGTVPAGAGTPV